MKGGLNSKLHAVCDEQGRPRVLLLTEGQVSDYKDAATMLEAMPKAPVLIADRGYDADWFRQALRQRGTKPCIFGRAGRNQPIRHGKALYRQRHKAEIMFGRLKDWRRIATRLTIAAPTASCPPSASPPPSRSGCHGNES